MISIGSNFQLHTSSKGIGSMLALRQVLLFVFIVCPLLFNCSLRGIAFRYAEWIVDHKIDDAFDLTGENYRFLKIATADAGRSIRQMVLPRASFALTEASFRLADGLDSSDINLIDTQVLSFRIELIGIVADGFAAMAKRLSTKEIDHFERYLADENSDLVEFSGLPPADFAQEQNKRATKNLKYWVGPQSKERFFALNVPFLLDQEEVQRKLEVRRSSQKHFLIWLRGNSTRDVAAIAADIKKWAREPFWFVPNGTALGLNSWMKTFLPKLQQFDKLLTPAERGTLQATIISLGDDCTRASKS